MYSIKDFLERYAHITPPDGAIKDALVSGAEHTARVHLSKNDVRVIHNVAYVDTDSAIKNKLFLKKKELLVFVNDTLGGRLILRDIQ